jgi:membrane fusion protein (multidrug efflux system)
MPRPRPTPSLPTARRTCPEFTPREVAQPQLTRLSARLDFSGPLVAPQTAVVRAKAPGTLLALNVAEGSRVAAGQALGRIDLAEQTSRLAERSASIESARAALVQAERTHASNERLAAQQFISPIALENSRAALDSARAALQAAQAAAETARIGLRDATLVSPIAGIVAKRHVVPGEKVAMEQQLLTIVDLARLELAGAVGTHEVSRLAPGMAVQVQVEGVAQPVAGRIARIAPAAEPGTRSIGVTIELPNPQERLRAGQYAVAQVELADDRERLTLPLAAIGNTAGQDHVWMIENGQLARRAVKLGRRDERDGRVEVVEGVPPQAQVLAARFDNLREGAKASVVATKATPVASAAASTPALR